MFIICKKGARKGLDSLTLSKLQLRLGKEVIKKIKSNYVNIEYDPDKKLIRLTPSTSTENIGYKIAQSKTISALNIKNMPLGKYYPIKNNIYKFRDKNL